MPIPGIHDSVWRDLVSGRRRLEFKFLAAKVMLGRLLPLAQREPAKVAQCASELHQLFVKNEHLPSVQLDLKQITG